MWRGAHLPFSLSELVVHVFRKLLEFALRLGIVGVDDEVLEVPEIPTELLKPLALLEVAGDLGTDLAPMTIQKKKLERESKRREKIKRRRTLHVLIRESVSPKLEKAMKNVLPWKGRGMSWKMVGRSNISR